MVEIVMSEAEHQALMYKLEQLDRIARLAKKAFFNRVLKKGKTFYAVGISDLDQLAVAIQETES